MSQNRHPPTTEVSSPSFKNAGKFKIEIEIAVNENLAWECLLGNNFWKMNPGFNDFIQNLNSGDASLNFNRRTSRVRRTLVKGTDVNPERALEDNMAGSCIQVELSAGSGDGRRPERSRDELEAAHYVLDSDTAEGGEVSLAAITRSRTRRDQREDLDGIHIVDGQSDNDISGGDGRLTPPSTDNLITANLAPACIRQENGVNRGRRRS